MKIYFYCTYEHSAAGFCMTCLKEDALVPAPADGPIPREVDEFFSYDRFSLLWRDLCSPSEKMKQEPHVQGGLFGLRGITGRLADGRNAAVNLAFLTGTDEIPLLTRTALKILGDYDSFCLKLPGWLSAGGPCSYQLDVQAFRAFLAECAEGTCLKPAVSRKDPAWKLLCHMARREAPKTEVESLRLAVYLSAWENIAPFMGSERAWKKCPGCALSPQAFKDSFTGRGQLWEIIR